MLTAVIANRNNNKRIYCLPLPATDTEWAVAMRCVGIEAWEEKSNGKQWCVLRYNSSKNDPDPLGALGRYESKERLNTAGEVIKQMDGAEIDDLIRICEENKYSWEDYPIAPLFVPSKGERGDMIADLARMAILLSKNAGKNCPELERLAHISKYARLDESGFLQPVYADEIDDIVAKTKSLMLKDALTKKPKEEAEEVEKINAGSWRLSYRNSRREKAMAAK